MADQLNMNNLSLQDSQHAPKPGQQAGGFGQGRSAYIPPHMRQQRAHGPPAGFDGPPPGPPMNGYGGPGPKYVISALQQAHVQ